MSLRIGMRELRAKLAEYLESAATIEVSCHGQTIGFYIPVPRQPNQSVETWSWIRVSATRLVSKIDRFLGICSSDTSLLPSSAARIEH